MQKLKRYLMMAGARLVRRYGFDVRKAEEHCWPDQAALLRGEEVSVVFDLGANVGEVAKRYRELFPDSSIHCFEPMPSAFGLLKETVGNDDRTILNSVAVSDSVGETSFVINEASDTSSLLAADLDSIPDSYRSTLAMSDRITVPVTTVDDYCLKHRIEKIDVLKLDIQGGELAALRGAHRMLSEQAIRLIYTEVFFLPFYRDQPLFGDIAEHLGKLGYSLHAQYNMGFSGRTGRLQWADCVFVNRALSSASRELHRKVMR